MKEELRDCTLEIYKRRTLRRSQRWGWRFSHWNGRVLAQSSEGYANRVHAEAIGGLVCSGGYTFNVVRDGAVIVLNEEGLDIDG